MNLSIISSQKYGYIYNIYINTGYYAVEITEEMNKNGFGVQLDEVELSISKEEFTEKFDEFIKQYQVK